MAGVMAVRFDGTELEWSIIGYKGYWKPCLKSMKNRVYSG